MHLTNMDMATKLSAKGQVVIPKDVRDRMRLTVGETFDVVERENEVVLKRRGGYNAISAQQAVAEAVKELQKIIKYDGPPVSIEDMNHITKEKMAEHFSRKYGKP
jgi:AbrB family looped-hinge helix DNA binding protein